MVTPWTGRAQELDTFWTRSYVPDYRAKMIHFITKFLREDDGYTVLDAGCGTGITYRLLPFELRERYTGIDFEPEMVAYCRAHYPNGDFRPGDVLVRTNSPSADLVITQNVLQHIVPWQLAAWNLIHKAQKGIIFCERSHRKPTRADRRNHVQNWQFNEQEMVQFLSAIGKRAWNQAQRPRVLARPRDTGNKPGKLTVYGMRWG